jgi:hypothetical protein
MSHSRQQAIRLGTGLFACALLAAGPALAAVTLDARSSEVTATAKAYGVSIFGEDDGPFSSYSDSTTGLGDFVGRSASASSQSSALFTDANAYAFQNSTFTLDGANLTGASAYAEMTADGETSSGGLAIASSLDDFSFQFTVTGTSVPYALTGSLNSNQSGGVSLRLYNTAAPGTFLQSFDDNASINATGLLPPGQYRIELAGYLSANTDAIQHLTGGYNVTLALPVPEPASALLLAAPLLTLRRRRRHG